MTNREKYAEEILDIACSGSSFAVQKNSRKIIPCSGAKCSSCLLNVANKSCNQATIEWADAEYKEKPNISKMDRDFLDYIPADKKWLVRRADGALDVFRNKPIKDGICLWESLFLGDYMSIDRQYKILFPMVKWEDEEPWLIEDLKKLEVVEEYENN